MYSIELMREELAEYYSWKADGKSERKFFQKREKWAKDGRKIDLPDRSTLNRHWKKSGLQDILAQLHSVGSKAVKDAIGSYSFKRKPLVSDSDRLQKRKKTKRSSDIEARLVGPRCAPRSESIDTEAANIMMALAGEPTPSVTNHLVATQIASNANEIFKPNIPPMMFRPNQAMIAPNVSFSRADGSTMPPLSVSFIPCSAYARRRSTKLDNAKGDSLAPKAYSDGYGPCLRITADLVCQSRMARAQGH